jgi:hypothetical protein
MERFDAKNAVVVVLLIVVAIGALAEVVAGRSARPPAPARAASWQILARAGDAARVRSDAPGARRAYLAALHHAHDERSVVGVLRAAEGFKALGDREMVEEALQMAATLTAGPGRDEPAPLQALRDRLDATDALPIAVNAPR